MSKLNKTTYFYKTDVFEATSDIDLYDFEVLNDPEDAFDFSETKWKTAKPWIENVKKFPGTACMVPNGFRKVRCLIHFEFEDALN